MFFRLRPAGLKRSVELRFSFRSVFSNSLFRFFVSVVIIWSALSYASHLLKINWISTVNTVALSHITSLASLPLNGFYKAKDSLHSYTSLLKERDDLKEKNKILSDRLFSQSLQLDDLKKAQNALEGIDEKYPSFLIRILGVLSADPRHILYGISKEDVAKKNNAVFNEQGLIGRVSSTQGNKIMILLITDVLSRVPVRNLRSGICGLAIGEGGHDLKIDITEYAEGPYNEDDAPLKEGDVLVTAGFDDIFPQGIPVGRIACSRDNEYRAIPFVKFNSVQFAHVLKK